jgi:hypothetical protein
MPHTTRKRASGNRTKRQPQEAPRKAPQKAAKATRTYGLGERNPETLPNGHQHWETHSDNERATARWAKIRASVMTGGPKYTGYGA